MKKTIQSQFIFSFLFAFFVYSNASAQEPIGVDRQPAQTIIQDKEIMERAKAHNYRNGAEEGELRVQAQLPKPQRKISPVIDKTEEEKESQDHD